MSKLDIILNFFNISVSYNIYNKFSQPSYFKFLLFSFPDFTSAHSSDFGVTQVLYSALPYSSFIFNHHKAAKSQIYCSENTSSL